MSQTTHFGTAYRGYGAPQAFTCIRSSGRYAGREDLESIRSNSDTRTSQDIGDTQSATSIEFLHYPMEEMMDKIEAYTMTKLLRAADDYNASSDGKIRERA